MAEAPQEALPVANCRSGSVFHHADNFPVLPEGGIISTETRKDPNKRRSVALLIESLIKNLNQDVALLQRRIERDKDAGFNDMARLLESMSIQFFKAVDIANLKSKNQIKFG